MTMTEQQKIQSSKRGRKPKGGGRAMTSAERVAASRARREGKGGKQVSVVLSGSARAVLDELIRYHSDPEGKAIQREVIEAALIFYANSIFCD